MTITDEITAELDRADAKHGRMQEMREGFLTLKCEVTELEREVMRRNTDREAMRKEAIQCAAMRSNFCAMCAIGR